MVKAHFEDYQEANHFIVASLATLFSDKGGFPCCSLFNRIIWVNGNVHLCQLSWLSPQHIVIVPSERINDAKYLSREHKCRIILITSRAKGDTMEDLATDVQSVFGFENNQMPSINVEKSLKSLVACGIIDRIKADKILSLKKTTDNNK